MAEVIRLWPYSQITRVNWRESTTTDQTATTSSSSSSSSSSHEVSSDGPRVFWQMPVARVGDSHSTIIVLNNDAGNDINDLVDTLEEFQWGAANTPGDDNTGIPNGAPPGTRLEFIPFDSEGELLYKAGGGGFYSSPVSSSWPHGAPAAPTFTMGAGGDDDFPYQGAPDVGTPFYVLYVPVNPDDPPGEGT